MNRRNAGLAISLFGRRSEGGQPSITLAPFKLQPSDPEANIGLAKVFMTMDQPQKAEPLLQHALQLDPTSAVAHFRLSTIYRQTGRTADAKHELEEYQKYKQMKEKLRDDLSRLASGSSDGRNER